jgi:hypothetical protein
MSAQLLSMRIVALAQMMSLLFFALALWFVIGADTGTTLPGEPTGTSAPPLWGVLVPVVVGVGSLGLISVAGYRAPALAPGTPADEGVRTGLGAVRTGQMLRFALAEAAVIVSIAAAFVVEQGGYLVFLLGAAISLVLSVLHVWPRDAQITRVQEQLESAGARAPLLETLHGQPTH